MCILLISTFCFLSPPVLLPNCNYCCSVAVVSKSLWPHGLQHTRPPWTSPTPRTWPNSCPSSWWCHPTISSSVAPSPPVLNLSQNQGLSQWVGSWHQSIRVSTLASILAVNIQGWFSLGLTGLISLQSKGLSRVFSSITNHLLYGPTLTSVHNCNYSFI